MSTILGLFATQKVTIFREGGYDVTNPYASVFTKVATIDARFKSGGTLTRDDEGAEFTPQTTFVTEYSGALVGDKIALGELSSIPTNAETVRKVETCTPLVGAQDYRVVTG